MRAKLHVVVQKWDSNNLKKLEAKKVKKLKESGKFILAI